MQLEEHEACQSKYRTSTWFVSITTQFQLYCEKGYLKSLFESLTVFGFSFLAMVLMSFQDKYGYKKMTIYGFVFATFPGCILVVFIGNLHLKVLGLILVWGYINASFNLMTLLSNELLVNPLRNFSNVIGRLAYCSGGYLGTFLVGHFTDYRYIVSLYFAGFLSFTLLLVYLVPDSPSFLLKQKRNNELRSTVTQIAHSNGLSGDKLAAMLDQLDSVIESDRRPVNHQTKPIPSPIDPNRIT